MNQVNVSELPFDIKPSFAMGYQDYAIKEIADHLTVAYLADDERGENPLESCDGMGAIYTAHRWGSKDAHRNMQEALALDGDWDPELSLLEKGNANLALRKAWITAARQHVEFQVWADDTGRRDNPDQDYYHRRAAAFWLECEREGAFQGIDIWYFAFTNTVAVEVWRDLRSQGVIGDKDAVQLDCYEHGGQVWSISGSGHQCRWDTSRCAGVWVPDDSAREAIDTLQGVYAFGSIHKESRGKWKVVCADQEPCLPTQEMAFKWLEAHAHGKKASAEMLAQGRDRARQVVCSSALEEYNAWLAGECYGVIVAEFSNAGTKDDPVWEFVESDSSWGFIGSEYAAETLPTMIQ